MRCKICKKTIKHAGKITRKRRICGECMYATKHIVKTIYSSQEKEITCKIRKLPSA